jgi:hypothetical protein
MGKDEIADASEDKKSVLYPAQYFDNPVQQ